MLRIKHNPNRRKRGTYPLPKSQAPNSQLMAETSETGSKSSDLTALELNRIVPLSEASRLSSLSEDTLRRRYPEKIMRMGLRREGMRVKDALMIP